jgi:hypothetical protein
MSVPPAPDATDPSLTGVAYTASAEDVTADIAANTAADSAPTSEVLAKRVWSPSDRFLQQLNVLILLGTTCGITALLGGRLLVRNTTATGGDMGAHVWTADFLQRKLIPSGRLMGWSDDWFGGFPALSFYFPFPFWLIAALDIVLPYNVAFKLVTVLGLITCPLAAWVFGRCTATVGMRTMPVFLALATLPYLFDRQWSIYGGNVNSTMAGEFSFAIAVSSALLFLGLFTLVIRHGTHRAAAGVALATTGLSHLLPTLWAAAAGVLLMLCFLDAGRTKVRNAYAVLGASAGVGGAIWITGHHQAALLISMLIIFAAIIFDDRTQRLGLGQFSDAFTSIGIGSLLVMVWAWPFWNSLAFTNDMSYEKEERHLSNLLPWTQDIPPTGAAIFTAAFVLGTAAGLYSCWSLVTAVRRWMHGRGPRVTQAVFGLGLVGALVATAVLAASAITDTKGTRPLLPNAVLWFLIALLTTTLLVVVVLGPRLDDSWERLGVSLTLLAAAAAAVFRLTPFGFRLWNNRVLLFYALAIFLLAAFGLHQLSRAMLRWVRGFAGRQVLAAAPFYALIGVVICTHMAVAMPLGIVPKWAPAVKVFRQTETLTQADGSTATAPSGGWNFGLQRVNSKRMAARKLLGLRVSRPRMVGLPAHYRNDAASRTKPRVRACALGVRTAAGSLGHPDGTHAAPLLDEFLYWFDGGSLL